MLHWGFVHALVSVITPLAMVLVTDVTRRRDSVADAETLWTMGKIGHWKREKVGGKLVFKAYIQYTSRICTYAALLPYYYDAAPPARARRPPQDLAADRRRHRAPTQASAQPHS